MLGWFPTPDEAANNNKRKEKTMSNNSLKIRNTAEKIESRERKFKAKLTRKTDRRRAILESMSESE